MRPVIACNNKDAGRGKEMVSNATLTGAAGEHHVLSELLRNGYVAGLAPVGTKDIDIVVVNEDGSRFASIQVKTRRGAKDGGWPMRKKHESITNDRIFYAFVDFQTRKKDARPLVFVIPSKVVAKTIAEEHRQYLLKPGKGGIKPKSSDMRNLWPHYKHWKECPANWLDKYKDAWGSLGLETIDPDKPVTKAAEG